MAAIATLTRLAGPTAQGDRWMNIWTAVSDNSYPTNGYPLTRQQLGFAATADPTFNVESQPTAGLIPEYDHTNQKLKVYRQKDPAAAGGADIALPEVANAVDLSAVTFRLRVTGKFLQ